MTRASPPSIQDALDRLDRQQARQRAALERSVSEYRRASELRRRLLEEVALPALHSVGRELERRRHAVKVLEDEDRARITVAVQRPYVHQGSLTVTWPDPGEGPVVFEVEGVPTLHKRTEVAAGTVDQETVARAALRLVEGLLEG